LNAQVRTAQPTDDLTTLWPALGAMKLHLDHVWVCVDVEQEPEAILGGVIMFDSGHEVVYVGELNIVSTTHQKLIAKKLVGHLLAWCAQMGKTGILFHTYPHNLAYAAMAMRLGAVPAGPQQSWMMPIGRA
jgi:hypothetical protein